MTSQILRGIALIVGLVATSGVARAQDSHTFPVPASRTRELAVIEYDLSGPRLGVTFSPDGAMMSQFGWHFEKQSTSANGGPSFIVEQVVLIGGVEQDLFMPSGTLVFGIRLPNSFEFGIGPSLTLGGSTALVIAAGHSFRAGGIRVPVNIALATDHDGQRLSIVTGWAIRDRVTVR